MPGLVNECQTEGVAAGAGGGVTHLQQGMKGDPGTSGQRDAGKWMEVGTTKEMSRLKRKSGSQRGVGGGAGRGGRITMGKAGLDARVECGDRKSVV